jgi:2,5-diketo-D-gluconate reductase B
MDTAALGPLIVSRLALGAMLMGEKTPVEESHRMLDRFVDAGGTLVDTADVYGDGTSERVLAPWLARRRDDVVLATKVRHAISDPAGEGLAPDRIRAACDASLRRLGIDVIDLYQVHAPDPEVPLEETLDALAAVRDEGLINHFGVSNFPAYMLRDALKRAPIFADQVEFHPFLGQDELVALAVEEDFMVTAYSPLARGKVPGDETLRAIAERHGKTAGQVALRWLLDKPNVATIPKASSHERRLENFEVFDFELSDDDRAQIDALPKDGRILDPGFAPAWEG